MVSMVIDFQTSLSFLLSRLSIGIGTLRFVRMLLRVGDRRGRLRRRWSVEQAPVFDRDWGCFAPEHRLPVLEIRGWSRGSGRRVCRLGSVSLLLVVDLLLVLGFDRSNRRRVL